MLALKNVSKTYGKTKVLDDISLSVHPGEFMCIAGRSSAGKSLLLSLLVGAEQPTSGTVEVDGVDVKIVPPPVLQLFRRRVGIVFQDYKLLLDRTVRQNVSFPLEVCGVPDGIIARRVPELLKQMNLTQCADTLPRELSAGEKMRTAIARAIALKPLIVLADDPTANLDRSETETVIALLNKIHSGGATIIFATRDTALAASLGKRVITLEAGRIITNTQSAGGRERRADPAGRPQEKHEVFKDAPTVRTESTQKKIKVTPIGS
ncbi:hypothetical protein A3D88_04300 [Candidatus Peribacteria bacterium RIFCSPHIGHO2_02_FULL_52_16]|nr:MAG: hypothetical protein A2706_01045 [Candidatus Peribacteria bacterium RIFCSPHIGHO2_01_FULL_51_35]OGJ60832.1 MAG: hypothetical protein A3D88_04300 [Candidatus Peribacteria bacterium RIFCSPHIGHO2_02_FULL_52_16]